MLWMLGWMQKSRKTNRNHAYSIVVFDVNGQILYLDGLRVDFQNNDVAWSFMKEYKTMYPMYDFGLVYTDNDPEQRIMIKYI